MAGSRPPVKPKPIGTDPQAGHLSVVIAFTVPHYDGGTPERVTARIRERLGWAGYLLGWGTPPPEGLDVAVRVVGAAGEASEHEGTHGPLGRTVEVARTIRDTENVEGGGRL